MDINMKEWRNARPKQSKRDGHYHGEFQIKSIQEASLLNFI